MNEAKLLPPFLESLRRCHNETDFTVEFVFVDGGSNDESVRLCEQQGFEVQHSLRGRGQQLAAGADVAGGEVLLFLHVDSQITPEHCRTAVEVCGDNGILAGGFRLKFDDRNFIFRMAELINLLRFRCTRVFYGDHGIFIRQDQYQATGGFPAQPLFEDIEFSKRLRKRGKLILTGPPMITSARRFRSGGIVRTYLKMAWLHILYWRGVSPERLADLYLGETIAQRGRNEKPLNAEFAEDT